MKHWNRRLSVKIACFILCILSLGVTIGSVFGVCALVEGNFYRHTEKHILEDATYSLFTSDAYDTIRIGLEIEDYEHGPAENEDFSTEYTNLRFQLFDPDGNVLLKNTHNTLEMDSTFWDYFCSFRVDPSSNSDSEYEDGSEYDYDSEYGYDVEYLGHKAIPHTKNTYVVCAYLEEELPVQDKYAFSSDVIHFVYSLRYTIYLIGIVAFFLCVFTFIVLMLASARKPNSEELHPGIFNHVPIDLMLLPVIFFFAICYFFVYEQLYYESDYAFGIGLIMTGILMAAVFLGFCMSIAARIKQKTLFSNTLIWRCCILLWNTLKWLKIRIGKIAVIISSAFLNIPLIWRTLVIIFGITFLEFIVILGCWWETDILLVFWLLEKLILLPLAIYAAFFMRKLQEGGIALAKGDLSFHVDTKIMFWDFKRHGENLNSIAAGMAKAVDQRLASERMKTELITNVSHDIKTPLTSIINYAGLIEEEPCNSEKHKEYSAVLIRKSTHLKHLLDDLVEISKAATGNLEVALAPCEAGVLLTQAAGEFEQRCNAANLQLITKQPEENLRIMADSRRIWRVFENLMSNACKYSLPGSRVYLSLEAIGKEAVFTFRNTSSTVLDITPEELMERFVRGDASRTTEGNGLGLSIAKSLTELQNGKMDIFIDGDLFKVCLHFPIL